MRGLAWSAVAVIAMHMPLNVVDLRALPMDATTATLRIGEDAAAAAHGRGSPPA